ncbi:DUF4304 domain-containing protein [Rhizobium lentis]|nr:DUF4304 domain-containing protein [Rhizobium lentis]MBX5056298.1 DUF4304 domain-containing protein [Rhizobium lentis]MBX5069811.1 DUF4304 domain-containing protein [Rhizobium lentis]MBX5111214.1 DUF4304 domain-containing protein [Rhizobium lentis]MBX5114497.1 DUF4304 domain-containing protein [Rhizobium lentis]
MLRAHGFKKSGRNRHKTDGENWLIVNVQASRSNFGDRGQISGSTLHGVGCSPLWRGGSCRRAQGVRVYNSGKAGKSCLWPRLLVGR